MILTTLTAWTVLSKHMDSIKFKVKDRAQLTGDGEEITWNTFIPLDIIAILP